MSRPSPFARGFRAVRREPAVLLVEIGWRWLFGGVATALLIWATLAFLHSVQVSRSEQFLLRTFSPELMAYALREMFRDKGVVLAKLALGIGSGLSFFWIATSTFARSAMTRVLLEDAAQDHAASRQTAPRLWTISAIQFLRMALLWLGLAAYILSALISDALTRAGDRSHPAAFLLIFLGMMLILAVVLSFANWILLLAPIFAIRHDRSLGGTIGAALRFSRRRSGRLAALNLAHLGVRLVWFVVMSGIAFMPLGFIRLVPKVLVFGAILAITLLYSAVADVLFVARYAGYIEIAEQDPDLDPELLAGPPPAPKTGDITTPEPAEATVLTAPPTE